MRKRFAEFGVEFTEKRVRARSGRLTKKDLRRLLGLLKSGKKTLRERDWRMMSRDGDGRSPWLDPRSPIPGWLIDQNSLSESSIDEYIAEYHWLGYEVEDPRTAPIATIPGQAAVVA